MEDRVFRRVQRYGWEIASEVYESGWVPLLRPHTAECVASARLRPGEAVVDLATGPGVAALLAGEQVGSGGRVLGLDIADSMVATALGRARALGQEHVRFERRDMEETGQPDGSFDAALCAFGLMFAANRRGAVAEIARVLRPGGRLAACVWGRRSHCAWAEVFSIVDAHVASDVCPLFFSLGVPGALAMAMRAAGFAGVEERRVAVKLFFGSAEEACATMFEGGAVALAYRRFTPEVKAEVRATYLDSLAPHCYGGLYEVPSEIVFAVGHKPTAGERAVVP